MAKSDRQPAKLTAPQGVSAPVAAWFDEVVRTFELEPHHGKLLSMAAESLQTWHDAHAAIRKHGLTFDDRFGSPHARPEVNILRDSRIAFARLIRELSLDGADAPEPPRPPAISGRYERTR